MNKCLFCRVLFSALGIILSCAAIGEDEICSPTQPGCVAIGHWDVKIGLGAGVRDNPLIESEDIPLFLLPDVSYYGERFFFDTYVGGFTFVETETTMVNAIGTISFDQIYFDTRNVGSFAIELGPIAYDASSSGDVNSEGDNLVNKDDVDENGIATDPDSSRLLEAKDIIVLERLHSRDTAILAGLEFAYFPGRWDISLRLLQDVHSVHDGNEAQFALSRYLTIDQEHFELATGFSWQDQKTLDYYWGVRENEVDNSDLAYEPESGMSPFVRIDWRRHLLGNWSIQATMHHRWLSSEIRNSPLVEENTILTLFVGGMYHF